MKNPLKRKNNKKVRNSGPTVHFKKTETHKRAKPKRDILPKVKKNNSSNKSSGNKFKRRIDSKTYAKYFLLVVGGFLLAAGAAWGAYSGTLWVIDARDKAENAVEESGIVLGFANVPTYPKSDYIFLPSEETDSVKEFISTGRTIYRLDWNTNIDKVYDFYSEQLPENGWEHVLSVPRTSNESKYGEYWIDQERNVGLRIYDRVNDIWYEKLSIEDAQSGLKSQVEKETERELIIASDSGIELLPDFPWTLNVPKEFVTKYFATNEGNLRGIQFLKLGTNVEYILEPVSKLDSGYDDMFLEEYVDRVNFRLEEGEDPHRWEIVNSQFEDIGGDLYLKGDVTSSVGTGVIYILRNTNNNYAYALFQPHEDGTFTQFVIRNLGLLKLNLNGSDFNFE